MLLLLLAEDILLKGTGSYKTVWRKGSLYVFSSVCLSVSWLQYFILLIIKPTRCTNFSNLFWKWNSTCFEQFLCPSSGVIHCTLSNCICHTGLQTAFEQDQDVPSYKDYKEIYQDVRSHECKFVWNTSCLWGTRWHIWLKHCATSMKVAGSIPYEVTGIFHWRYHSDRTIDLRWTQHLTNMSTMGVSLEVKSAVRGADSLTIFMCRLFRILGASTWACVGIAFTSRCWTRH
jgi:hypothetical protein